MNALDGLILGTLILAALGGYRLGFLARILSWAGLAIGVVAAAHFLPSVVGLFDRNDSQVRLIAALTFLLGVSMLAQGIGLAAGSLIHATLPVGVGFRQVDRVAGGVLGGMGVLVSVWLLTPALSHTNGWAARETAHSAMVRAIDGVAPEAPDTLRALKRLVGGDFATLPDVFAGLRAAPDVGAPPPTGLAAAVHQKVVQSTVKVTGEACRRIQEGSGFAVAPETVVTNAHVVAGEHDTRVVTPQGRELRATVVAFDPNRDIAILRVAKLNEPALTVGRARVGVNGAVYGHPGGGQLRAAPAAIRQRVTALGTDIYDQNRTRRDVFVLASDLHPGDSGGALVDQAGVVVGVAFAIAPDRPQTGYALTDRELREEMKVVGTGPVPTGPCIVH